MRRLPLSCCVLVERCGDAGVEIAAGSLHPIPMSAAGGARESLSGWHVEEDRDVGRESTGRQIVCGAERCLGESTSTDLIRVRGKKKPIEENDRSLLQRRPDFLRDELGARCNEQQRFRFGSHLSRRVEKCVANEITKLRPTGLSERDGIQSRSFKSDREPSHLRGLTRTLGSLENNQPSLPHVSRA